MLRSDLRSPRLSRLRDLPVLAILFFSAPCARNLACSHIVRATSPPFRRIHSLRSRLIFQH